MKKIVSAKSITLLLFKKPFRIEELVSTLKALLAQSENILAQTNLSQSVTFHPEKTLKAG